MFKCHESGLVSKVKAIYNEARFVTRRRSLDIIDLSGSKADKRLRGEQLHTSTLSVAQIIRVLQTLWLVVNLTWTYFAALHKSLNVSNNLSILFGQIAVYHKQLNISNELRE
jgi:hypothetical protein